MAFPFYRIHVTVGAYSYTRLSTDAAGFGIAAPLSISWSLPEDKVWPCQPNPVEAQIGIVVDQASDFANTAIGTPVSIMVYKDAAASTPPAGPYGAGQIWQPIAWFAGRVADMSSRPVKVKPNARGMLYTLDCVDYLVDLAEETVGGTVDWPQEFVPNRVARMMTEAGYPDPFATITTLAGSLFCQMGARPAANGTTNLLDILTSTLEASIDGETALDLALETAERYAVLPNLDVDLVNHKLTLNAAQPFSAVKLAKRSMGDWHDYPATFANLGVSGWGPSMDPDNTLGVPSIPTLPAEAQGVLDACDIRGLDGATWRAFKDGSIDTVTVTTSLAGYVGSASKPPAIPVGYVVDTEIWPSIFVTSDGVVNVTAADALARLYLPTDAEQQRWQIDEFELVDAAPSHVTNRGILPGWFGPYTPGVDGYIPPRVVAVAKVPTVQNPNPSPDPWYAGQLSHATFAIENRRHSFTFGLRPHVPRSKIKATLAASQYISPAALAAAVTQGWNTVKVNQLDPHYTVYDYRLVRKVI